MPNYTSNTRARAGGMPADPAVRVAELPANLQELLEMFHEVSSLTRSLPRARRGRDETCEAAGAGAGADLPDEALEGAAPEIQKYFAPGPEFMVWK